jgi:hypothetical protein
MSVVWLLSNKTPATLEYAGLFVPTVIALREEQVANAVSPMLLTLSGIVTLVTPDRDANALSPMEVTAPGTPGIDEGIVSAPPEPLYPVIVIAVPLTL